MRRVIYSIILVFFVATINFIIFFLMPGSPTERLAGNPRLKAEQMEEVERLWGLTQPLHIQYIDYLRNMFTWQFGYSFFSRGSISEELVSRLGNTLLLMGGSTVLSLIIGVILGVIAARRRGGIFDSVAVLSSLTTYSLPSFWMGMVALLIFSFYLGWFPFGGTYPAQWAIIYMNTGGLPPPLAEFNILSLHFRIPSLIEIGGRMQHLFLPLMVLTLFMYGGYLLFTRAAVLETLTEDYIVTARAKGLKERTVLFKHALKNASLPIITNAAISFGFVLSGAIITEQVFTYLGLGQWIWHAIEYRDYPVLQAMFFIIALCVIIANFIADLLYGILDPRVKYG